MAAMIRALDAAGRSHLQQTSRLRRADRESPPTIGPVTTPLPSLLLYGRPGCHLCEDARAVLDALLADRRARGLPAPVLEERSIEGDEALQQRYALTIPVVTFGGRELELATTAAKMRRFLADVLDGDKVFIG